MTQPRTNANESNPIPLQRPVAAHRYPGYYTRLDRRTAQRAAAANRWDCTARTTLRSEYLAYRITRYPERGHSHSHSHTVLWNRNYQAIWELRGANWIPILPWHSEAHHQRIEAAGHVRYGGPHQRGCTYLYDDSWSLPRWRGGLGSQRVSDLVQHVENQLAAMGLPIPPWFSHPCPPDSLAGSPRDRSEYRGTV